LDVKTQKLKDDKKMIQKLGKRNQPSELGRKHEKTPKTCNSRSKFPISFPYGSSMGMGTPDYVGVPRSFLDGILNVCGVWPGKSEGVEGGTSHATWWWLCQQ